MDRKNENLKIGKPFLFLFFRKEIRLHYNRSNCCEKKERSRQIVI